MLALEIIDLINREVNAMPQFSVHLGENRPAGEKGGGDCVDLAWEKRQRLIDAGQPEETMGMITCSAGDLPHAVLGLGTPSGLMILDNLTDRIKPIQAVQYEFGYIPEYLLLNTGLSREILLAKGR
jgi:predicted transglutaminase-like cysteine proteinase